MTCMTPGANYTIKVGWERVGLVVTASLTPPDYKRTTLFHNYNWNNALLASEIHDALEPVMARAMGFIDATRLSPTPDTGLIEALREVAERARQMPRATPAAGGCSTVHSFEIEAGVVWMLDLALKRLDTALANAAPAQVESGDAARSSIEELTYIAEHESTMLVVAQAALRAKSVIERLSRPNQATKGDGQ